MRDFTYYYSHNTSGGLCPTPRQRVFTRFNSVCAHSPSQPTKAQEKHTVRVQYMGKNALTGCSFTFF